MAGKKEINSVTVKFTSKLYEALEIYSDDDEILLPKDVIVRLAVAEYLKNNYIKMGNSQNKIIASILLGVEFQCRRNSKDEKVYKEFFEFNHSDNERQIRVI